MHVVCVLFACVDWPSCGVCMLQLVYAKCAQYQLHLLTALVCIFKTSLLHVFCSRGMVGWIVLILVAWIFINWTATYFALSKLNFLKR